VTVDRPCNRCAHSSYCEGVARQNCLTGDYFDFKFKGRGPDLAKRVANRLFGPDRDAAVELMQRIDGKLDMILAALQQQKKGE
jgi:sulfatase maturation enzyme AslB (radical SAM superfamily)